MRTFCLALCSWVVMAEAYAQTSPGPPPSDRVADPIGQLGARRFPTREAAARELATIGRPALATLDRAAIRSPDPEIRQRAGQIAGAIRGRSPGRLRIAGYDYDLPPWWDDVEVSVPSDAKDEQAVCGYVGARYGQWEGTEATWQQALKTHALADQRLGLFPVWVAHCHRTGRDYSRAAQVYGDLCDRAETQGKDADWYRAYLGYNAGLAHELAGERDLAAERFARTADLYPKYAKQPGQHDRAIAYYARTAAREAEALGRFDPAGTSTDPWLGMSPATPVPVGAAGSDGSPAQRYLGALRDPTGRRVFADRLGSVAGPADVPVDVYQVATSAGAQFILYLDTSSANVDPATSLAPSVLRKSRL